MLNASNPNRSRVHLIVGCSAAGATLVTAAALISPIHSAPPVSPSAAVLVQPTASFRELAVNTSASLDSLRPELAADRAGLVRQIVANNLSSAVAIGQPAAEVAAELATYLLRLPVTGVDAVKALLGPNGSLMRAILTLAAPLVPAIVATTQLFDAAVTALQKPVQNLANVLGVFTVANVAALGVSLISPFIAAGIATAQATAAVTDAMFGADASLRATARALVHFAPTIVDGFLNGATVRDVTIDLPFPLTTLTVSGTVGGLFSPSGGVEIDLGIRESTITLTGSGPIAAINNVTNTLADAIRPRDDAERPRAKAATTRPPRDRLVSRTDNEDNAPAKNRLVKAKRATQGSSTGHAKKPRIAKKGPRHDT